MRLVLALLVLSSAALASKLPPLGGELLVLFEPPRNCLARFARNFRSLETARKTTERILHYYSNHDIRDPVVLPGAERDEGAIRRGFENRGVAIAGEIATWFRKEMHEGGATDIPVAVDIYLDQIAWANEHRPGLKLDPARRVYPGYAAVAIFGAARGARAVGMRAYLEATERILRNSDASSFPGYGGYGISSLYVHEYVLVQLWKIAERTRLSVENVAEIVGAFGEISQRTGMAIDFSSAVSLLLAGLDHELTLPGCIRTLAEAFAGFLAQRPKPETERELEVTGYWSEAYLYLVLNRAGNWRRAVRELDVFAESMKVGTAYGILLFALMELYKVPFIQFREDHSFFRARLGTTWHSRRALLLRYGGSSVKPREDVLREVEAERSRDD